jgi:hypothetical protein
MGREVTFKPYPLDELDRFHAAGCAIELCDHIALSGNTQIGSFAFQQAVVTRLNTAVQDGGLPFYRMLRFRTSLVVKFEASKWPFCSEGITA